jgi:hypothetical protein
VEGRPGKQVITPWALAAFFAFAVVMTTLAGLSILMPEGPLAVMWRGKPGAYQELLALAPLSGIGFLAISVVMAVACLGTARRRRWGWWLALTIFIANGAGNAAQIFSAALLEGLVGVAVVAIIIAWMTRCRVRALFTD